MRKGIGIIWRTYTFSEGEVAVWEGLAPQEIKLQPGRSA